MGLEVSPVGHWLVVEMMAVMAGGSLFWEADSGECDRSWSRFNFWDNPESWRHDSFGRAKRGAWQMGLCLGPRGIQKLRLIVSHLLLAPYYPSSVNSPHLVPSAFSKKTLPFFQLFKSTSHRDLNLTQFYCRENSRSFQSPYHVCIAKTMCFNLE